MNNYQIQTGIGPVVDGILNNAVGQFNNPTLRNEIITKLVQPVESTIKRKIRPYVIGAFIAYVVILVLLIYIVCIIHGRILPKLSNRLVNPIGYITSQ